jgi:hypothetical protein
MTILIAFVCYFVAVGLILLFMKAATSGEKIDTRIADHWDENSYS